MESILIQVYGKHVALQMFASIRLGSTSQVLKGGESCNPTAPWWPCVTMLGKTKRNAQTQALCPLK